MVTDILLHETQTNMASWYDDPFKPVEGLINIPYDGRIGTGLL